MSRAISRYPGGVPKATFLNYDPPSDGQTPFIVTGLGFIKGMKVSFWDLQNDKEITGNKLLSQGPIESFTDKEELTIQGTVQLAKPGLYQLLLTNPGGNTVAQAAWIYIVEKLATPRKQKKRTVKQA